MLLKIHNRLRYFSRVTHVIKDKPGRYTINSTVGIFEVEGGRHAGGTSRDWFLEQVPTGRQHIRGHISCTSLMDALHVIETM